MNVFITSGTFEFLRNIKMNNENEKLILLQNENKCLLLQETTGSTLFKEPRKYETVDGVGELKQEGYIVMNNIPVSDEGRPMFEHMFKNRAGKIEGQPGFKAIRILRPIGFETYIILTQWDNESSFNAWQTSQSFADAHSKKPKKEHTSGAQKIFSGESFVTKFYLPNLEEDPIL